MTRKVCMHYTLYIAISRQLPTRTIPNHTGIGPDECFLVGSCPTVGSGPRDHGFGRQYNIGPVHKGTNHVPKAVSDRDPLPDWVRDLNYMYVCSHASQTPSQSRTGSAHCEVIF